MIGNVTDIFLDAMMLLVKTTDDKVPALIRELLLEHKNELASNNDIDSALNKLLVELLDQLLKTKDPYSKEGLVEKQTLVIKFLTNPLVQKDEILYNSLKSIFEGNEATYLTDDKKESLKKKIRNNLMCNTFNKCIKKMFGKVSAFNTTMDESRQDLYLNDIVNLARDITEISRNSNRLSSKAVESIDFSNEESLQKAVTKYKDKKSNYILKTGLQGLNKMLGSNKGFLRGETVMLYALTHNFKSGLMMTIARGFVKYNTPPTSATNGKPLILFITLENEANKNLMWLYKHSYEQIYKRSSKDLTDMEIIHFVREFFSSNGYVFMMERWDGTVLGYDELVERIDSLRVQGYDIVAVLLDYMKLMKRKEDTYQQLSQLTYKLCVKFKNEDTLFITPHQLEGEASRLAASGITNVVKKFGSHNVSGSKEISQHVDLEIFIHLETNNEGQKFLTMNRGKHRSTEDDTPIVDKYCAYPFSKYGIMDDIEGEPEYTRDIYSYSKDGGESSSDDDDIF